MAKVTDVVREAWSHWDDAAVLARTGRELHDRNRLDLAREVLGRALELDASDDEAWAHLAYAEMRDYMPEQGFATLRRGIERTGSPHLKATLAGFTPDAAERERLQAELAASDDPAVRAALLASRLWAGDRAAFAELRAVYEAHPDDARVRDHWLWILFASGGRPGGEPLDLEREGIPAVDAKIAADPERVSGPWMKAQLLHTARAWEALLGATEAALERFPDDETIMFLRARAWHELGDLDRAALCFARAVGMKPSYAGARAELARVCEAQGKPDLAEEVLREAVRANPGYAGGPVALALFLGRQGRWDEAETLFLEHWQGLAPWQQARVKQQPGSAPLLERERIRAALGS